MKSMIAIHSRKEFINATTTVTTTTNIISRMFVEVFRTNKNFAFF